MRFRKRLVANNEEDCCCPSGKPLDVSSNVTEANDSIHSGSDPDRRWGESDWGSDVKPWGECDTQSFVQESHSGSGLPFFGSEPNTEGPFQSATAPKRDPPAFLPQIAVFGGGLDTSATETKGTVLIESAAQLEGYTRSEEDKMEALIKAIADSGAKVVVSGQAVGEVAMHFCERYK